MRTTLALSILALIATAFPAAGAAEDDEDRWYEIEIVVFQHPDPRSTESWPGDPGYPAVADAVELAPAILSPEQQEPGRTLLENEQEAGQATTPPLPFQMIDESESQLGAVVNRLMLADGYSPVLHTAWRQPVIGRTEAPAVRLQSAMPQAQRGGDETLDELLGASSGEALFGEALVDADNDVPTNTVDGTITVSRDRYLHLEANLLFREAVRERKTTRLLSIFNRDEQQPETFRMQQQRRIRAGELHYFDHPKFGLIARVTPYEALSAHDGGEHDTGERQGN